MLKGHFSESLATQTDVALTIMLVAAAIALLALAVFPLTPTWMKVAVLAYVLLP